MFLHTARLTTAFVVPFVVTAGLVAEDSQTAPDATRWAGTWQAAGQEECKELTCTAKHVSGKKWTAEFKGVCSKRFCFNVTMTGRKVGEEIRFKGTTDLGKKNGGVYQWEGTIKAGKFTGTYESTAGKKGTFEMSPAKDTPEE